jgi:hypothetical protein
MSARVPSCGYCIKGDIACLDRQRAAAAHCIARIESEVHQSIVDLGSIGSDLPRVWSQLNEQRDLLPGAAR